MIDANESLILYGETRSYEDAIEFLQFKMHDDWRVLVMPYPSKQIMYDTGEDTTRPHITEWSFLLHKFHTQLPGKSI